MVFYAQFFFTQVGIGTSSPRGALDINKPITNNMGLVLPTNANANNIINPLGGNVVPGTIIYDSTKDCVRLYKGTNVWSGCLSETASGGPAAGVVATLDCNNATHNGVLTNGISANGVSSTVPYTGGNGGAYAAQSIPSTGVTGLTATINAGNLAIGNGSLTYTITGTPAGTGNASFTITIGGKSCVLTRGVRSATPPDPNLTASCTGFLLPYRSANGTASGTVDGLPVTATFANYSNVKDIDLNTTACNVNTVAPNTFFFYSVPNNLVAPTMAILFNREVSNLKVYLTTNGRARDYEFILKRAGVQVFPTFTMAAYPTFNCSSSWGFTTSTTIHTNAAANTGLLLNLGNVWFDEVQVKQISSDNYDYSYVNFCVGNAR